MHDDEKSERPIGEVAPEAAAPKKPRGFALLSPERRQEISRKGGRTTSERGKLPRFTTETAREAGKKGGRIAGRGRPKRRDELAAERTETR